MTSLKRRMGRLDRLFRVRRNRARPGDCRGCAAGPRLLCPGGTFCQIVSNISILCRAAVVNMSTKCKYIALYATCWRLTGHTGLCIMSTYNVGLGEGRRRTMKPKERMLRTLEQFSTAMLAALGYLPAAGLVLAAGALLASAGLGTVVPALRWPPLALAGSLAYDGMMAVVQ